MICLSHINTHTHTHNAPTIDCSLQPCAVTHCLTVFGDALLFPLEYHCQVHVVFDHSAHPFASFNSLYLPLSQDILRFDFSASQSIIFNQAHHHSPANPHHPFITAIRASQTKADKKDGSERSREITQPHQLAYSNPTQICSAGEERGSILTH